MTPDLNPQLTGLGLGHFIAQADVVGKTLLAILVLMSIVSWAIVLLKGATLLARRRRSESFLTFFWNATSLDAVAREIATHGARDPFAPLAAVAIPAVMGYNGSTRANRVMAARL